MEPGPFCRVKLARSAISDAHDIVSEQIFFIFGRREKRFESIARREEPDRPSFAIDNRNAVQFPLPHDRPDVIDTLAWPTEDHAPRHDHHAWRDAAASLAMADLSNEVCPRDHADHGACRIANDGHAAGGLEQELCRLGQWGIRTNGDEAVTRMRQYALNEYDTYALASTGLPPFRRFLERSGP